MLQTMLTSRLWPEGRSDTVVLQEEDHCAAVFPAFLEYLYTGTTLGIVSTFCSISCLKFTPILVNAHKFMLFYTTTKPLSTRKDPYFLSFILVEYKTFKLKSVVLELTQPSGTKFCT